MGYIGISPQNRLYLQTTFLLLLFLQPEHRDCWRIQSVHFNWPSLAAASSPGSHKDGDDDSDSGDDNGELNIDTGHFKKMSFIVFRLRYVLLVKSNITRCVL